MVVQGKKYANYILANCGKVGIREQNRANYASVLDILAAIRKKKDWRDHITEGAQSLKKDWVKKIFNAPTRKGRLLDYEAIRNKAIAVLMIANQWVLLQNIFKTDTF